MSIPNAGPGPVNRVAVVVPTYDRPALLVRAIRAIDEQDYSEPFTIYVIEDGSESGEKALNQLEGLKHPLVYTRIKYNSGSPARSRNIALQLLEEPLVAFCDDDDVWYSNHLRELVEVLGERDIAYARWRVNWPGHPADGKESMNAPFSAEVLMRGPNANFVDSHVLVRRERVLEAMGLSPWREGLTMMEVYHFNLAALAAGLTFARSAEVTHMIDVRVGDRQLMFGKSPNKHMNFNRSDVRGAVIWRGSSSVQL